MEKLIHSIEVENIGTVNIEIANEPNGVFFEYPKNGIKERVFLHNPQTNRNLFKLSFPYYTALIDGNGDIIEGTTNGLKTDADVIDEAKYRQFSEMDALPPNMEICDLQFRASINHLLLHKFGVQAFDPLTGFAPIV